MTVHCFIQARSNSSRLHGKVMMSINGVPLLIRLYQRLQACKDVAKVVVLTAERDPLVDMMPKAIPVFRGPEADVAKRFALALAEYDCMGFVRVCADSPFVAPGLVDLAALGSRGNAYVLVSGGRSGLQTEGFRTRDFLDAEPYMKNEQREHIGLFFREGRSLAIDTQEDYDRLKDVPL